MSTTLGKTRVMRFSPTTASDALDGTHVDPGACSSLSNLIPDPSTKNLWAALPGATAIESFGNLNTPLDVEVIYVLGNYVFGLINDSRNAGKSEPFCYQITDLTMGSQTAITVYNVLSTNTPSSIAIGSIKYWPTMALVGNYLYVTHPGFSGSNYIGWFDISVVGQPIWNAGNLTKVTGIVTFGAITPGSGYVNGIYNSVPLTGGTGSGATATIFVAVSGLVIRVVLNNPGTGYVSSDSLSASNANLGGSGTGFAIVVATVQTASFIQFTTPPQWVAQFYQRGWFGVNPTNGLPSIIYTDILANSCTNANQALTFSDNIPTTIAAGLGLNNQLGGVIQSLMVFKSTAYIIQITGDAAFSPPTLATNTLNVATGTLSARGVVSTQEGLAFIAPDGLRMIDFAGTVSDPIGEGGAGIAFPFIYNSVVASNSYAFLVLGCNRGIIRASVNWAPVGSMSNSFAEFWYDMNRKIWSGPHDNPYSQYANYLDGWIANFTTNVFTTTPLYSLVGYPNGNAVYIPITNVNLTTVILANETPMSQLEITELQVMTNSPAGGPAHMTVQILDQDGNTLATQTFTFNPSTSPSTNGLYPRQISFVKPPVVTRFAVSVTAQVAAALLTQFQIGDIYIRVRDLGYLQELPG